MPESNFRPCAVIPVYNHQQRIGTVVARLLDHGLEVILVDDGSEPVCAAALAELARQNAQVTLLRLPVNSGKGAAVCHGLRHAGDMGFTHALQVDADGQHDLNDVPRFLACGREHPQAVISGWRSYDQMPPARRRGRRLTDFWVCVNSVSRQLKDSMCGYRLYPLSATLQLLQHHRIGARMDFDTDILVRLYWEGAPVRNIPTHIVYQDDIASHFDILRDNLRIIRMHTRLFLGMLRRLPQLAMRNPHE